MKTWTDGAIRGLQNTLVHLAGMLVPLENREEWRREWSAELWHVRDSFIDEPGPSQEQHRQILSFCLGAFPDALCIRTQSARSSRSAVHVHSSAGQCLLCLATFAVGAFAISSLLPGVNAEREATQFQIRPDALLIADSATNDQAPSIPIELYRDWEKTPQRYFQDLAFYRMSQETVRSSSSRAHWNVAYSSTNLFSVLGLPIQHRNQADQVEQELPALILSHRTWVRFFAHSEQTVGRILSIGHAKVRILGVAPAGSWRLPGDPDAWLLEPEYRADARTRPGSDGYLIAQLSPRGQLAMSGPEIAIAARGPGESMLELYGAPICAPVQGVWSIYRFAVFLALLALPAVISVSLGESNVSPHRASLRQRFNRLTFLLAKFLLIAVAGLYASLDLAYWYSPGYSPMGECIQLTTCFALCLGGFRWAVADQRERCPVCLGRVTNPATVGFASRTFLSWNGTEMICMGGHTLLHVPSLPTSWFGGPRWLYLDSSWDFLFVDT